jgi:hypothetical protein
VVILAIIRLIGYVINDDKRWRKFLFLTFLLMAAPQQAGGCWATTACKSPSAISAQRASHARSAPTVASRHRAGTASVERPAAARVRLDFYT